MARQTFRVVIPSNPEKKLDLAELVLAKHTTDGASSPLNALVDNNWTTNGPKVAAARALQDDITQREKDLENLYKQRNLLLAPVTESLKGSRDALVGIHRSNPKKLGDWGFVVNDSPKAKKKDEPKP
jgi:hypothetical protein